MTTDSVPSGVRLPAREAEILACAAKGLTDKQIAMELGISRDTVGTYWRRILLRYNASSRTEVVARASEHAAAQSLGTVKTEVTRLHEEIRERATAQARELAHRNVLTAIQDALLGYVSGERGADQVFASLLNDLIVLTQSEFGFIAELHGSDLHALAEVGGPLKLDQLPEIARQVLKEGRPYLVRELEGETPMSAFLGLPVKGGVDVVGMIGLANRPGGYDKGIPTYLEPLAATCGTIIKSERIEAARREAEQANLESVARLETLLNSLDSGVVFVDETRKVRYANSTFCRHFTPGFGPQEILGMSTQTLLEEFKGELKDPEGFVEWVAKLIAQGESKRKETVHAADGRVFVCNFDRVQVGEKGVGHVWRFTEVLSARSTTR